MPQQVIIVHGWNDTSKSFTPLGQSLQAHGYQVMDIWLADYETQDDDVACVDVAKRLETVLSGLKASGQVTVPFDMVVHSTGGLVARQWLVMYDRGRNHPPNQNPEPRWLKRLDMLAPANFGSVLANLGKSGVGRLTLGLGNWFQTGATMLTELELSSPFQWGLITQDVLAPSGFEDERPPAYDDNGCWPFVIIGGRGYQAPNPRCIINEPGEDGTVRCAAANLNAYGATIDFSNNEAQPTFTEWSQRSQIGPYPFRIVPDEDHSSIKSATGAQTLNLILQALQCGSTAEYQVIQSQWKDETNALTYAADGTLLANPQHQFFMLNTYVVDDQGNPVADHFIEFFGSKDASDLANDGAMATFHSKVIVDVHQNKKNLALRCFHLNRTEMMTTFYGELGPNAANKVVSLSISAAPPGANTKYFTTTADGAAGSVRLHLFDPNDVPQRFLQRNCTHFLKIVIPRYPLENVLTLHH
ncbi:MAG: hypothetical protein JSR74_00725 [Proteobacteria bacterium]|nr:hypothetical protein [Pseudomonadota bacterium]